jgi:hypothetical protein
MRLQDGPFMKERTDPGMVWDGYEIQTAANVTYNVRQTESLVSPYMADVSFLSMFHQEVERSRDPKFKGINDSLAYRAVLAMQDGKWVLKNLQCKIHDHWEDATTKIFLAIRTQMGVE